MARRALPLFLLFALASCRGGRSYLRVTATGDSTASVAVVHVDVSNAGQLATPFELQANGAKLPLTFALEFDANRSGMATVTVSAQLAGGGALEGSNTAVITPGEVVDVTVAVGTSMGGPDGGVDGAVDGGVDASMPSCGDGKKNGQETDVDCGGPTCDPCVLGLKCTDARDCRSNACVNGACAHWEPTGPWGGVIRALEVRPGSDDGALAGTIDGLYRTTNGGGWWRKVAVPGFDSTDDQVNAVAYQPGKPAVQWIGTDRMLTGTGDDGASWSTIDLTSQFPGKSWLPVRRIAIGKNGTIYVGTPSGVAVISNGKTVQTGLVGDDVTALFVNPNDDQQAWAGTDGKGVFLSKNGGGTWTPLPDGKGALANQQVFGFAIAPGLMGGSAVIYVASDAGLFAGDPTGGNWQPALGFTGASYVRDVAVDPTDSARLLASTDQGTFTYSSSTWSKVPSAQIPSFAAGLVARFGPGGSAWAGTAGGVFRRAPGGTDFHDQNRGMHAFNVTSMSLHPTKSATVFAVVSLAEYGGALLESDDQTDTWKWIAAPSGLAPRIVVPVQLMGDVRLIVGGTGDTYQPALGSMYLSTGMWAKQVEPLAGATSGTVMALVASPVLGRVLAGVGNGNGAFDSWGIYVNTNNGSGSWVELNSGVPSQTPTGNTMPQYSDVYDFAFDARGSLFAANSDQGVLKYDLLTMKWSVVSNPDSNTANGFGPVNALAAHGQSLYAGAGNGVWVCDDTSALSLGWRQLSSLSGHSTTALSLAVDPQSPKTLWAGTIDGIVKIDTGGLATDWQSLAPWVEQVIVDPTSSKHIYAATGGSGLWRTTTGGN